MRAVLRHMSPCVGDKEPENMKEKQNVLGILGGLGPMATAYFMELVITMTSAGRDQDHLKMVVCSDPAIPDRTAYILHKSDDSPLPEMIRLGQQLAQSGAGCIAIPCVTAHYFWQELCQQIPVPVLNAIAGTTCCLQEKGIRKVGIMATDGTIATGIVQRTLEEAGMQVILPGETEQQGVMDLIYRDIKAGKQPDMDLFARIRAHLFDGGAEAIILACTELSLIKKDYPIGPGFIDALEVLARQAVEFCGAELKKEYRCLITG